MALEVLKHPELVPKVRVHLVELLEVVDCKERELGIFGTQR
jgi:hypothetical protein